VNQCMDIRQLRYFLTIVEEGQITRAAKKLNIAQPPLSRQLKVLEEEFGTKLFVRNGRQLELTQAGQVLYKRGITVIHNLEETVLDVKQTGEGIKGSLSIGTSASCKHFIPSRIRYFRETYPKVTFKIWENNPFQLSEQIHNRNIELAIVPSIINIEDFSYIHLKEEPFVFIAPENWKIASETKVNFKKIAELPLLLLHRVNEKGSYKMIIHEFKSHGLKPNIICESPDASILISLVEEGVGATILPKSSLFGYPSRKIKILDLDNCSLKTETYLVWKKVGFLSKIAKRFIETFQPLNDEFRDV
jgi:DNA-binding transcriptional LysR family regulator